MLDFFRINNNHRVAIITADGIIDNFFKRHKWLNISNWGEEGIEYLITIKLRKSEPLVKTVKYDKNLHNDMDNISNNDNYC